MVLPREWELAAFLLIVPLVLLVGHVAVQAHNGRMVRLPVLAGRADEHA